MDSHREPEWIVRALAEAAERERAPMALRERLAAAALAGPRHRSPSSGWAARGRLLLPAMGLLAGLALAIILLLPGAAPAGPSVAQAASLGVRGGGRLLSTGRAGGWVYPPPGARHGPLDLRGVRFPAELSGHGDWRPAGSAVVMLAGRRLLEIRYHHAGWSLTYLVAAAPTLAGQRGGYSTFALRGRPVVSWVQAGHSCLLVGSAGTSRRVLLALARS
ncbi:MAG TPA: hypothetical protein VFN48_01950 [Solirubrobacteraceae bacterium]|nr:hypothetical protein [Solirubrobacteraceae bacterium]